MASSASASASALAQSVSDTPTSKGRKIPTKILRLLAHEMHQEPSRLFVEHRHNAADRQVTKAFEAGNMALAQLEKISKLRPGTPQHLRSAQVLQDCLNQHSDQMRQADIRVRVHGQSEALRASPSPRMLQYLHKPVRMPRRRTPAATMARRQKTLPVELIVVDKPSKSITQRLFRHPESPTLLRLRNQFRSPGCALVSR